MADCKGCRAVSDVLVGACVFHHLVNLQKLYLGGNQLQDLHAGVFDKLTKLTILSLHTHQLQALPTEGAFGLLGNLEILYMCCNKLIELPSGAFDKLTRLKQFGLDHYQLKSVPVGVFDRLGNLKKLSLYGAQLTTIPKGAFDSLKKLQYIWLHSNPWDWACRVASRRDAKTSALHSMHCCSIQPHVIYTHTRWSDYPRSRSLV
ncbi:carboxypeptidase N subunit 2-like [Lethenteron reissneri]|uniref:carboxypeptidase N subunit 2-like n=1 Tax=Lethenteron reissneri TaxID=7753 RepID=UPI002AB60414|nr:carboxypeptidase N subunit 2-like [Lethenteron reissneri]